MSNNILIIAGEASGDIHGASLIKELMKLNPELNIYGIGGNNMIEAGLKADYHIKDMAFMGFWEILKHLPFIKKVKQTLLKKIKVTQTKIAVLIDYPGFNLNIAKSLKKNNVRIIYYISPQLWAWGKGRIKKIKQYIDKMLVIFPFEEQMYKDAGIDTEFVGHPLVERITHYKFLNKDEFYTKFNLPKNKEILLIMPGSREQEINKIFPAALSAAERLAGDFNLQTVVACPENINEKIFRKYDSNHSIIIIKNDSYNIMKHAKFGIIKSGTSTLEAGYFKLPFIVIYSTNFFTYLIGKLLIRIKNIAMVNIIAGENIIDELIQKDMTADNIYSRSASILANKDMYASIKNKLNIIKIKLGNIGASEKAASAIYAMINEN